MEHIRDLLKARPIVGNVGSPLFAEAMRDQGAEVLQFDWTMPCHGDERLFAILERIRTREVVTDAPASKAMLEDVITAANRRALDIINNAHPFIVGIGKALDTIPGMAEDLILHAGPPITWDRMCGPMRGAVIGALIYEGRAASQAEAERLASSGSIHFEPCHHHAAVGPMAGIISPSMPVWIIENRAAGNRAFATLNEGLGKVLRFGAFSGDVIERLKWMERVLAPTLAQALAIRGEIDLRLLIAQALQMGDEGHNRNRAGTSLLVREFAPAIALTEGGNEAKSSVLKFMASNDHFFLNLTMPAAKSAVDAVFGLAGSSIVSTMARNGTDFGIRVCGLGARWFTAPAPRVKGLYFPGFSDQDANPDIGDSTICETYGIGGLAMAAAPAIVQFVGGSAEDAIRYTLAMYRLTAGESSNYRIPALGFRGTPTGIDVIKVVETGSVPVVNTGIAHKEPGIGQVGAGLVEPPLACFEQALVALDETLGRDFPSA
ncbi:MAG TPA: DUF1116 domain-containing protein [bacterium]|nr:DUF1116 domain-containing protein [bacterium]